VAAQPRCSAAVCPSRYQGPGNHFPQPRPAGRSPGRQAQAELTLPSRQPLRRDLERFQLPVIMRRAHVLDAPRATPGEPDDLDRDRSRSRLHLRTYATRRDYESRLVRKSAGLRPQTCRPQHYTRAEPDPVIKVGSHMIDATELALRLRSQFVAQPLYRRNGVSDCHASVSSLPPRPDPGRPAHLTTSMAMPRTCLDTADAIELAEGGKTLAPLSSLWPSPMASPSTAPLPYRLTATVRPSDQRTTHRRRRLVRVRPRTPDFRRSET
jgi:hypothetical protein